MTPEQTAHVIAQLGMIATRLDTASSMFDRAGKHLEALCHATEQLIDLLHVEASTDGT